MAAAQAEAVATTVAPRDRELIVAAAWLHDIGYADALCDTGFHPLDGARYLVAIGAPLRLAALVAHHSEAVLLAQSHGLASRLAEFQREDGPVRDALIYADMTAGPTGQRMRVSDRLADIRVRHAVEDPLLFEARRDREPLLIAAVLRVLERRNRRDWSNLSCAGS
jgi:HD superfamily phosphodiesterase